MMKKSPSGHTGMKGKSGSMHMGMSRKNPRGVDASMNPRGGSVNNDATRGSTAATPRTLSPRDA